MMDYETTLGSTREILAMALVAAALTVGVFFAYAKGPQSATHDEYACLAWNVRITPQIERHGIQRAMSKNPAEATSGKPSRGVSATRDVKLYAFTTEGNLRQGSAACASSLSRAVRA